MNINLDFVYFTGWIKMTNVNPAIVLKDVRW